MNAKASPLGPKDYLMLNKITVNMNRKRALTSSLYRKYGAEMIVTTGQRAGNLLPSNGEGMLADLIRGEPAEQWLQKQIDKIEEEEGLLIANVIQRYGQEGKDFIKRIAYEHGVVTGVWARRVNKTHKSTVTQLYILLEEYFFDGWPNQRHKKIVHPQKDIIICHHNNCVHLKNWKKAKVSFADMCEISGAWVAGFCGAFGQTLEYKKAKSLAWGDPCCEEVFKQKMVK